MRIISGSLKGRSIKYLKNNTTRPLKDSVKENIFNILKHSNLLKTKIENAYVLDLYSGIGSFGIECISRGAKKVFFIEQDINAINLLKQNLIKLSILDKSKIYSNKIENLELKEIKEKFDLFFFDPPFKDYDFIANLKIVKSKKIFRKDHIVIIHRERKSLDDFENLLKIIEIKQYGRSKIVFGVFN
tara:strand:- start:1164 stop:1724 length:561 start_codon:yes stop_codon:yes gene_type:complete